MTQALAARAAAICEIAADDASMAAASPCISVCKMSEASGLCEGCYRTIDEIARWASMSDEGKRDVWLRIEARLFEDHPTWS
ncbi:DUF1289 domain-containing protein [Variovorax sp. J22R133]|uniref:DUF1289 domain-containing protein n=1 Tax=Variovorax brevis TaxID=3053503 RepID=UPI002576B894|nr:DUF1289 domain-containing protein [Variovorax sp. J22R133]MDM0114871.1 DUF1289 domain-containing protein [Variovorax sp. J22R133]